MTALTPQLRETLGAYVRVLRESGMQTVRLSADARRALGALASAAAKPAATTTATVPTSAPHRTTAAPASSYSHSTPQSTATPARPAPQRSTAPVKRTTSRPVVDRSAAPGVPPRFTVVESAPIEIVGADRVEKLANLAKGITGCSKCPHLAAFRTQTVFGVGNPEAQLMFVGEAPGMEEDKQGEPFVGAAGQLLTKMIVAMGLSRETVYIGNVLKCRPDMPAGSMGNRKPTHDEMQTCLPYLRAQIEIIQPKAIVALGATAVEGLFGPFQMGTSIGRLRGKFMDFGAIPVMPTYHPSYILRSQSITEKRKVWEDLLKAMERLGLPISEKQRGYFLHKK